MSACIVPGSFDPVTLGHLDVIQKSSRLFQKVVVALLENPEKTSLFSTGKRVAFLKKATAGLSNVEIVTCDGMLCDLARTLHIQYIVRGLRDSRDFAYERQMAAINGQLCNGLETVFLLSAYPHISASAVREILKWDGDISPFVCAELVEEIKKTAKEMR